jgi:hypothetical protein
MTGMTGESMAPPEFHAQERLRWPARISGRELVVSIDAPLPSASMDVLQRAGEISNATADAQIEALARLARRPGVVAVRSFLLQANPPVLFTLAVMLADLGDEPPTAEGREAVPVTLPAGDGLRITTTHELGRRDDQERRILTVQYVLQTPYGALSLTFATPHVDSERLFTALFETIAASCRVDPALTVV